MVIENLDVNETLEKARRLLKEDGQVSPVIAAIMEAPYVREDVAKDKVVIWQINSNKRSP